MEDGNKQQTLLLPKLNTSNLKVKLQKRALIIGLSILIGLGVIIYGGYNLYSFIHARIMYNQAISKALTCEKNDKFAGAIFNYRTALKYKPGNKEQIGKYIDTVNRISASKSYFDQANIEMENKRYIDAITNYKKVISLDTKRYKTAQSSILTCINDFDTEAMNKANLCYNKNDYDGATTILSNVFRIDSKNPQALKMKDNIATIKNDLSIANTDFQNEKFDDARKMANNVLAIAPSNIQATTIKSNIQSIADNISRANSDYSSGKYTSAQQELKTVITLDPNNAQAKSLQDKVNQAVTADSIRALNIEEYSRELYNEGMSKAQEEQDESNDMWNNDMMHEDINNAYKADSFSY